MEGSSVPSPCPLGSIGLSAGRTSPADCSPCPSGFFCNDSALTEPTGPCSPGLIILIGREKRPWEPEPGNNVYLKNTAAFLKILPSHCVVLLSCLNALFTTGYFCTLGSSEPSPVSKTQGNVCPVGHFCPQGSGAPRPCPVGSFLPEPGASALSQCHSCPPGQYCLSPGSSQPTGGDGEQVVFTSYKNNHSHHNKWIYAIVLFS